MKLRPGDDNLGKPPASRRKSLSGSENTMSQLITKLFKIVQSERGAKEQAEWVYWHRGRLRVISMSSTAENVQISLKDEFQKLYAQIIQFWSAALEYM